MQKLRQSSVLGNHQLKDNNRFSLEASFVVRGSDEEKVRALGEVATALGLQTQEGVAAVGPVVSLSITIEGVENNPVNRSGKPAAAWEAQFASAQTIKARQALMNQTLEQKGVDARLDFFQ